MTIKTIIFDLGDVILPLNYEKMYQAFAQLGVLEPKMKFETEALKMLWKQYDDSLPTADFRLQLRKNLNLADTITDKQIDLAWNELYDPIPKERLDYLRDLRRRGFEVLLLSNNNEIHHKYTQDLYGDIFKDIFHDQFYSNKIGLAKPDVKIFKYVLGHRNPKEVLFLDDKELNIRGAKAAGIFAMQFTVRESMDKVGSEMDRINRLEKRTDSKVISQYGFFAAVAATAAVVLYRALSSSY